MKISHWALSDQGQDHGMTSRHDLDLDRTIPSVKLF